MPVHVDYNGNFPGYFLRFIKQCGSPPTGHNFKSQFANAIARQPFDYLVPNYLRLGGPPLLRLLASEDDLVEYFVPYSVRFLQPFVGLLEIGNVWYTAFAKGLHLLQGLIIFQDAFCQLFLDFLDRRRGGKKEGGKEKEGEGGFHDWRRPKINDKPSLQVLVGEVEVLFPVVIGNVMLARANVVTDASMDGLVDGRLFSGPKFVAEQFVDWFRS